MSTTRIVKERDWTKEKKLAQDAGTATKECAPCLDKMLAQARHNYCCAASESRAALVAHATHGMRLCLAQQRRSCRAVVGRACRQAVQASAGAFLQCCSMRLLMDGSVALQPSHECCDPRP